MAAEFGIGMPLPQFRQQVSEQVSSWIEVNGMIARPPKELEAQMVSGEAVLVYINDGEKTRPVAYMAVTRRGNEFRGGDGTTAELGAMVKDPDADINGIGVTMTQALVDVEQGSERSDSQIAFATSRQSTITFQRAGGEEVSHEEMTDEWFEDCAHCPHQQDACGAGRRCCATVFDLTNTTFQRGI